MKKSEYIIYIDESGDHGLQNIDKEYPVFVLSFCCFKKQDYVNEIVPKIQNFKFKYFGHDQIILHENPIRKQKEEFTFLRTNAELRTHFLNDINEIVENSKFEIFTVIIDKNELKKQYKIPKNPYDLGINFGMKMILNHLLEKGERDREVHLIFEKRGVKEDAELELEFRRICDDTSSYKDYDFSKMKFTQIFASKKSNSTGLQFADMVSRPIGLNFLRPHQDNRAYEIIESKIIQKKKYP